MLEALFSALLFAIAALLLKNFGWRGAPVFVSIAFILLLGRLPSYLSSFNKLFLVVFVGECGKAIAKIIGIGYLFGISSDVCRELGEPTLASGLTFVGRFEMLTVSAPFLLQAIESMRELFSGF